jgi:hypothetical protein
MGKSSAVVSTEEVYWAANLYYLDQTAGHWILLRSWAWVGAISSNGSLTSWTPPYGNPGVWWTLNTSGKIDTSSANSPHHASLPGTYSLPRGYLYAWVQGFKWENLPAFETRTDYCQY